jgi:hypothetical protein
MFLYSDAVLCPKKQILIFVLCFFFQDLKSKVEKILSEMKPEVTSSEQECQTEESDRKLVSQVQIIICSTCRYRHLSHCSHIG